MPVSRILIATDFGESSAAAYSYACEFANAFGAALHVVHVVGDIRDRAASLPPPLVELETLQAEYEADARRKLDAFLVRENQNPAGADMIVTVLASNHTAAAILDYATAQGIDLIVVGTHGRNGFVDLFMGSVAQQIVRTAPCPVVTLRGPGPGAGRKDATPS